MKKLILFTCALTLCFVTSCETESIDSVNQEPTNASNLRKGVKTGNSVYVSSNTSGILGIYNIENGSSRMIGLPYADADGVVYDGSRDAIYHVNRSDSKLVALSNISNTMGGDMAMPTAMGPSTFTNGREATFYNNKVVVVDDVTPGKLISYHVNTRQINDFRQYNVGFEVWGIQATGKDLWAIEDVSNILAYFENFHNAPSGDLPATSEVAIEGLVRTHGLNYDEASDIMVLTDIGSAGSPDDGALVVITDFKNKFMQAGDGGTISLSDQIRIEGDLTQLGNPVDVVVRAQEGAIYVAERAQQKFLVFDIPLDNCNCEPTHSHDFPGASAITTDF